MMVSNTEDGKMEGYGYTAQVFIIQNRQTDGLCKETSEVQSERCREHHGLIALN